MGVSDSPTPTEQLSTKHPPHLQELLDLVQKEVRQELVARAVYSYVRYVVAWHEVMIRGPLQGVRQVLRVQTASMGAVHGQTPWAYLWFSRMGFCKSGEGLRPGECEWGRKLGTKTEGVV